MSNDQTSLDVRNAKPEALSALLSLSIEGGEALSAEQLRDLLLREFAAPVQFEMGALGTDDAANIRLLAAQHQLLLRSFNDLLFHPSPPLELLRMTKDFAKASRNHPQGLLPAEIAEVLYHACIVSAFVRLHQRITQLDDASLCKGLEALLSKPWLDDGTRTLLQGGLEAFRNSQGKPQGK